MIDLDGIIQEYGNELSIFEIKLNISLCDRIIGKYAICKRTGELAYDYNPLEQKGIITDAILNDTGILKIRIDNGQHEWWHGLPGHSVKVYKRKPND